jgi:hypothetical protein
LNTNPATLKARYRQTMAIAIAIQLMALE